MPKASALTGRLESAGSAGNGPIADLVAQLRAKPNYTRATAALADLEAADGAPALRVALGGNCTTEFLMPGLKLGLVAEGFDAEVVNTPFDGWIGEALAGTLDADVWIVWLSALGLAVGGCERRSAPFDTIAAAMQAVMARGQRLFLVLPEAMADEADPFSPMVAWRLEVTRSLLAVMPQSAIVVDPAFAQRRLGDQAWHAPQYWSTAKAPCHPRAMTFLGLELAAAVARAVVPRVRAIVVDLDNTLWGGIVGEVGVGEVVLDAHGLGRPYLHLQRFLKDLSDRGVCVSVVSKNNPEDALAPFLHRPEMILKREDIVSFEASWDHKYKAIGLVAERLALPLSALCFLDDSPHERAEARHFLPELIVPDLAEDPEDRVAALVDSRLFWIPAVVTEDRARAAAYRSDDARRQSAEGKTLDDYLRDLDIHVRPSAIDPDTLPRVGALIHKTNQFNLTNRRHGPAHLARLVADGSNYAYCFAVGDRFGDAGIVGVLIGVASGEAVEIDTFLLSCRMLNRQVELAMAEHFRRWADMRGIIRVVAVNERLAKNQPTWELLPRLGFAETMVEGACRHYSAAMLSVPGYVITLDEADGS